MNLRLYAALITAGAVGFPSVAADRATVLWGPVTNDVRIAVSLKDGDAPVKTNQPFTLLIHVQNLSTNQPVRMLCADRPEVDELYSFRVLSPSGKDVSPSVPRLMATGGRVVTVAPNETKEFEFDLRKLCSFNDVGTYRIVAKREIWPASNRPRFAARSGLFRLTVVPGHWESKPHATTNTLGHW